MGFALSMVHIYSVNNFDFLNKVQREIMKSEHNTIGSDQPTHNNNYQSHNNIFHRTKGKNPEICMETQKS